MLKDVHTNVQFVPHSKHTLSHFLILHPVARVYRRDKICSLSSARQRTYLISSIHTVSVIENSRLVLYREIMIGCSEIFNKHRTTMGREWNSCILHLVKVKPPPGQALRSPGD